MTATEPTVPETTSQRGWPELQYDHRDVQLEYTPYDLWKRMRTQCPISHSDKYGGFWFVSRYDDVRRVLKEWQSFTTTEGINIPRQNMTLLPGEVDPPLHRKYRDIINPLLSKEAVAAHEPWIRELALEWIARIPDGETFDLIHAYSEPFADRMALRVIGFDEADLDKLAYWVGLLAAGVRDDEEGIKASMDFFAYLGSSLEKRTAEGPRGDIVSALAFAEVDGERLTAEEQLGNLLEITFGGLHTTGATIAGAIVWLAGHPEDRARLVAEPELMPSAVQEFIRYVTPVQHLARTAVDDVELGGCPIVKGEKIMFGLGSANRDETRFVDPDDVVLDRAPNQHLAFGFGPHRCAGNNLGATGVHIAVEEFLRAFPRFEVADYYGLRWKGGEGRALVQAPIRVHRR